MSKNKYGAEMEKMEKISKKVDDETLKIQCRCYHHGKDNMSPSIIKVKAEVGPDGKTTNNYIFKCTNCKKKISLKSMGDDVRRDAINTVSNMVDLIKMQLNPNKEEDAKVLVSLARFQFRLERRLESAYGVIVLGKGKKRKKTNDRTSDKFWGKSVVR